MRTAYLTDYTVHDNVTGRDYRYTALLSNWILKEMLSNGEYHVLSAEMVDVEEYLKQHDKIVAISD